MAGVRLTLKEAPPQRLDFSALRPDALAGLDAAAIERLPLAAGGAKPVVGDLFRVRPGSEPDLAIEGGSQRFDHLGAGMAGGTLLVEGDGGICAGRAMTGGRLTIRGSVLHWAAAGLRGGALEITGDVGDFLGGARAGEATGMAGGVVLVRGSAGARAADRMRRGLLVIEGKAGGHLASRMIAGTVVCAAAGAQPGVLMRRGTLLLGAAAVGPTFVPTGLAEDGAFLRLLARTLRPLSERAAALAGAVARRFAGDMATLGKGEILLADRIAASLG